MKLTIFTFAVILTMFAFAQDSSAQTSRGIGVPYPNATEQWEKEVNKLVAIADTASTCDDARSYVRQLNYIVDGGGSFALARAKTHVEKANKAIADVDRSWGGCKTS